MRLQSVTPVGAGLPGVRRWRAVALALALVTLVLLPAPSAARAPGGRYGNRDTVILIDNSERVHGRTPLAPLWVKQLERFYTVRQFGGPFRGVPGQTQDFRITPTALRGVDLFILVGFSGTITGGSPGGGSREIDYNLSPDEMATLDAFVRGGGALLVLPFPAGRPNNLAELLGRFGIGARNDDARFLDERPDAGARYHPVTVEIPATLAERAYTLTLTGWLYPLVSLPAAGATVLAAFEGHPVLATVSLGAGRVVYLGAPSLAEGMWTNAGELPVGGDNPAFLLDLIADATGARLLTPEEARQVGWEVRVARLEGPLYSNSFFNGAPRARPTEIEWASALLGSAATGRRCDVGPGCADWRITPEQRAFLEQRAAEQTAMLDAFARLEAQLQTGAQRPTDLPRDQIVIPAGVDYTAVERDYATVVETLAVDQQQRLAFNDLYRQQGGKFPTYDEDSPPWGLALFLPLGLVLLAGRWLRRRRRPSPARGDASR